MSIDGRRAARPRRGRAAGGLVFLLLLVVAGGAVAAWLAWDGGEGTHAEAVAPPAAPGSRSPVAGTPEAGGARAPAPRASDAPRVSDAPRAAREPEPRETGGRGLIRGTVHAPPGEQLPATWRAVVEPSFMYRGEHPGVRRTVEIAGGSEFSIDDLPLAGYAVHADAPGYNSPPVHLLLTPGSEQQIVTIVLSRAGFLDGSVLDASGQPVEGLLVTLEADTDRSRRGVSTQVDGTFLFRDVLDGGYTIYFGQPEAPLVEPRTLAFKAPSLRFPQVELPVLGELVLYTFDREGLALADVSVRGFGKEGDPVETLTDDAGKATIGLLRPGRYRLFASTEDGRESRAHVDVVAGEKTEVELRLHAR